MLIQTIAPFFMLAHELLKAGRLTDAIAALQAHLKEQPEDRRAAIFLFELTCFTGDFANGESMLQHLVSDVPSSPESDIARYGPVLRAERFRQDAFLEHRYPKPLMDGGIKAFTGSLNGKPFSTLSDVDGRIGSHLEVLAEGEYYWISFSDIRRLGVPAPRRLRDLLWLPIDLSVTDSLEKPTFVDPWVPMMSPLTWQHEEEEVKLGRIAEWRENQFGDFAPFGLKSFMVDASEVPLAEVRQMEIYSTGTTVPVTYLS